MMRFCPSCQSERALHELLCEGQVGEHPCDWDLSREPIREAGWRPLPVVTREPPDATVPAQSAGDTGTGSGTRADPRCTSGHAMQPGDLMCLECGGEPALPVPDGIDEGVGAAEDGTPAAGVTSIDGWTLVRAISQTDGVRERYIVRDLGGRQAVLTLYRPGAEPDPSVYEALRRLPREHVPELIAIGRWNDRAYEVAEELTGGTLADLGSVIGDIATVRRVVGELGCALNAFGEAGLRHRDLRPGALLVRSREPLDLVVGGFGSARLSDFDLDIVAPLETSRYMAPEAIAGGVAAASDWWSLGMVLLEQLTQGACFEGVNPDAWLIHVVTHGVVLPGGLDPQLELLLRGLLARDRELRWQWPQVQAWLDGAPVSAPVAGHAEQDGEEGAAIVLGDRRFRRPGPFALAAAEDRHWAQALEHLLRGAIVTWAEQLGLPPRVLAGLRQVARHEELDGDARLMLALKLLNHDMPLIRRGRIVTPGWLLEHPLEGYRLVSGPVPDLLEAMGSESWLWRLKHREVQVRERARHQDIELDEQQLRICLLSTSRARLAAQWQERQRLLPDSEHPGLRSLADRRLISEEDLIVLLGAAVGQFRPADAIIEEAAGLARAAGVEGFDAGQAAARLEDGRQSLFRSVDERVAGFARCGLGQLDGWAEQFRLERRLPLARALVLLAVPREQWLEPQKQQYVSRILEFFEKKVVTSVMRGPLVRMGIGTTTARVDINALDTARRPASALLDALLLRQARSIVLDPECFAVDPMLERRVHGLYRQSTLYKRDTGIDGLHLGFPFLLTRDGRRHARPRIAPLLLWPVKLQVELGLSGRISVAFDSEREEVRLNPALEALVGAEASDTWRKVADEVLGRSSLTVAEVMDAFGVLAGARSRVLQELPPLWTEVEPGRDELACAAVLFHVTFMGQALGEDLRQLKAMSPAGTGLETVLRLGAGEVAADPERPPERERYFTAPSDPSQEDAVRQARQAPGLLVEGPPGTGKSQTIVNMVADAIGRKKSLLIVCQKHAALEVVYKRLVAEGLGNRIVMVNDVNRDREPVVRAVREQLQALQASVPARPWRGRRERLAARIESLEGELDGFHASLHRVDERIGLSYRGLLGELVELERRGQALDVPALRPHLAGLDIAGLMRLEEACAPLAALWLPARYEGSLLGRLQAFAADAPTLEAFQRDFALFEEAEQARLEALQAAAADFEVEAPEPYREWLQGPARTLLALEEGRRRRLARWLPLFRNADGDTAAAGMLVELEALAQRLRQADGHHYSARLSPVLAALAPPELEGLAAAAQRILRTRSWLARLSPLHVLRRRRVAAFLAAAGGHPDDPAQLAVLVDAAGLETYWRPLRERLGAVRVRLGVSPPPAAAGPDLLSLAADTLTRLRDAQELAVSIATAPRAAQLEAAVLTGSRQSLQALLDETEAALLRQAARQRSVDALDRLARWAGSELVGELRAAIDGGRSSDAALAGIRNELPTLQAYQAFRPRAAALDGDSLAFFALLRDREAALDAIPHGQLESVVRHLLNREARLGWKQRLEREHPALLFGQEEAAAKIASLAEADAEMRRLNGQLLSGDIDVAALGTRRQWEDVTRLRGRRSRRLREFIELGAGIGLMELRPVWLMNPDVASRVLPLRAGLFDTVIYDEASQMPVEYALPTLFRGRVVVVSGDEKQMPPTTFFSSRVESDEEESFDEDAAGPEGDDQHEDAWNRREIQDCPDLLQLVRGVLPATTLEIHYRSAYRQLIAFSNASFYDNRLSVPVRHPRTRVLEARPLELIQVDGLYQEQTNEEEAEQVVDYVSGVWRLPVGERPSIGVVTFNRKQADLIEERMELRAETDDAFRIAFARERERSEDGEDMSVFVKNVENVQGDERDVIVFSSTFGRNRQGTFRRNFGVLGQAGGERRLNVAVTRARRKVVMVTSMPIADVSDLLATRRRPSSPRDYLQAYLEYARSLSAGEFAAGAALLDRLHGGSRRVPVGDASGGDGFTAAVGDYIRTLGWNPVSVDEGDTFSLDFAIEDPATGLYAIGIECDSPRHPLLRHARSREIWRRRVLARSIPHVHRVSSQGWLGDGDAERRALERAIALAMGAARPATLKEQS